MMNEIRSSEENFRREEQMRQSNQKIADEYFRQFFSVGKKSGNWQEISTRYVLLCKEFENDPQIKETIEIAKFKALNLPDSLQLSEKAWLLFKERTKNFQVEFSDFEGFKRISQSQDNNPVIIEIKKRIPQVDYYNYAYCFERSNLIGIAVFEYNQEHLHILYTLASDNKPGAGLFLNEKIIESYDTEDSPRNISLSTKRKPFGLGNLGFQYKPADLKNKFDAYTYAAVNLYEKQSSYK